MKTTDLFEDFEPVSAKGWKQKIQVDLKGGDYNELLTWISPEGILVKPCYTAEDLSEGAMQNRGFHPEQWSIGYYFEPDREDAVERAEKSLENGVETLLMGINRHLTPESLHAFKHLKAPKLIEIAHLNKQWQIAAEESGGLDFQWLADPIGTLASTGNWAKGFETDFELLGKLGAATGNKGRITIHADLYQNSGATRIQELAYSLAQGHEYLLRAEKDKRLQPMLETPVFFVAMGYEYFFEIAKLRALRALWKLLAQSFGYSGNCHIIASPSRRNKTLYDYNTNMLRSTTECMAAVIGGADTICNPSYDVLYHHPNEFGDRIGRNQLLLLRHEGYFSRVSNPADGAYFIEALTDQLGSKSLELFKTLEKGGGLLRQLKEHKIQKKIKVSALQEQKAFDEGKLVLVGTNKYPNPDDRMKSELQVDPFPKSRKEKTLIAPILPVRLSQKHEQNRLNDE